MTLQQLLNGNGNTLGRLQLLVAAAANAQREVMRDVAEPAESIGLALLARVGELFENPAELDAVADLLKSLYNRAQDGFPRQVKED